ncbi:MAG TPA: trypsin-like peptidase domain-containing protein [Ilumatobacter sp.]|nr:trypsin-like peptidase domain-containing protein [Ilumatobacter sp.]
MTSVFHPDSSTNDSDSAEPESIAAEPSVTEPAAPEPATPEPVVPEPVVTEPVVAAKSPFGPPPPPPPSDPPRPKRRFAAGLLTGVAATGLVAAVVFIAEDDSADPASGSSTEVALTPVYVNLHDLVVEARPSIVAIHTTLTRNDVFGEPMEGGGSGTGWVVAADGFIVTNAHVVEGADTIRVTLDDGSNEVAEVVASDPRADLAVLKIDRDDLVPLPIGDSETMNVGDPVIAIGNALDLGAEPTVTDGIVSAKDRTIVEPNGQALVGLIQTSAAINLGNSGGPLLNLRGEVVGVNTAVAGQGQNIGFAIAITAAEGLIEQLQDGTVPRHALLGVTTSPVPTDAPDGPVAGAVIVLIAPDTAAADSALQEGDIIVDFAGEPIASPSDLALAVARHEPDETVSITYFRDGESDTITVALGSHPDE